MTSQKKIDANRKNALKSTGPVTPSAKFHTRLNALKHGVFARLPALPGEVEEQHVELIHQLSDEFNPETVVERMLVDQIADDMWRLQRLKIAEGKFHDQTRAKRYDRAIRSLSEKELEVYLATTSLSTLEREKIDRLRAEESLSRALDFTKDLPANRYAPPDVQATKHSLDEKLRVAFDPAAVLFESITSKNIDFPFEQFDRLRRNLVRDIMQKQAALIKLREDRNIVDV